MPGGEGDGEEDAGRDVAPERRAPPHVLDPERDRHGEGQRHPDGAVHGRPEEEAEGEAAEGRVGEAVGEETQAALDDEDAEERPRRPEGEAGAEGAAHEALGERREEGVQDLAHHSSSQRGPGCVSWSWPLKAARSHSRSSTSSGVPQARSRPSR